MIDRGAAPALGGLGFTINGPEWAFGTPTDYIVYTRFPAGASPTPTNAQVGLAWQQPDGSWSRAVLAPARNGPYGSVSRKASARITYKDSSGNVLWRVIGSATEEALPGLSGVWDFPVPRFAADENSVVYPLAVAGVSQVFKYEFDMRTIRQLTTDAGNKDEAWLWSAPDFANDPVVLTIVDKTTLKLFRCTADTTGAEQWSAVTAVPSPDGGRFYSAEPFIYQGRSYAVAQLIGSGGYPSSIWLAGLDPAQPLLRRLTPESPEHARADPEVVVTDQWPIVYFSRLDPTKGSQWLCFQCQEGLYRTPTWLPPPR